MIIGVGTDIVEIDRVEQACERMAFLEKIYTEGERTLIAADKRRAAGNFAVKEAVSKVFGTGFSRIKPRDIEVLRDPAGKPYVNLYAGAKQLAQELGIERIHVSISDTKELVVAFAVGEGGKEACYGTDSQCGTDESD
ncbi:MAG: holo-ACP synthase [Lachnospiraceae bacterium]|nr:holo-ACP synthase [Lachnospiraceae bacterium]